MLNIEVSEISIPSSADWFVKYIKLESVEQSRRKDKKSTK